MITTQILHRHRLPAWLIIALLVLVGAPGLHAQTVTPAAAGGGEEKRGPLIPQNSMRGDFMEISVFLRNFSAPTLTVPNISIPLHGTHDATMSIDDTIVYGLSFGFNYNERVNLNIDLGYGTPNFDAVWGTDVIQGHGSMWLGDLNLDYSLLKRRFSPFVSAGVGFLSFDSGVPSGGGLYYWWDPYWGYVGGIGYSTHSSTHFTWNGAVGVRWDVSDYVYLKAAYQVIWGKIGINGTEAFPQYTLNIGYRWN
jgi:opacity protein-like surface antigen